MSQLGRLSSHHFADSHSSMHLAILVRVRVGVRVGVRVRVRVGVGVGVRVRVSAHLRETSSRATWPHPAG